jgi:hypothetical protein
LRAEFNKLNPDNPEVSINSSPQERLRVPMPISLYFWQKVSINSSPQERLRGLFCQQFSFQKVTIYTDRNRDLTGGKIAIANQCWTGVISAIQSL